MPFHHRRNFLVSFAEKSDLLCEKFRELSSKPFVSLKMFHVSDTNGKVPSNQVSMISLGCP